MNFLFCYGVMSVIVCYWTLLLSFCFAITFQGAKGPKDAENAKKKEAIKESPSVENCKYSLGYTLELT